MERCLGCMEICDNLEQCPSCGYIKGTPAQEIYHLVPGTMLCSKYTVGKVLGYGGFGVTYIGWDNVLERKVAIKEFLPGDLATRMPGETRVTVYAGEATEQFTAGLQRFTDEAKRLAKFNGTPGIVGICDTFNENNTGYIVMELLEGKTVSQILRTSGVFPYEKAEKIIENVLTVLDKVHQSGIIHRDIAPDNIFVTNSGEIKVIDFGAARYATTSRSKSLSVILKPGYAPEEQYRRHGNQGPWSDVYAVAATFYKLITGVTIPEAMERIAGDKIKPPSSFGVKLPQSAENAIMNALVVDADFRTRSCSDFLDELQSESVKRITNKHSKAKSAKTPLWLKIAIPVLAVTLVATLGLFITNYSSRMPKENAVVVNGDGSIIVPNLVNMTEEEAKRNAGGFLWFKEPNYELEITQGEPDENTEAGRILSQDPRPGERFEKGSVIRVVMSIGNPDAAPAPNEEKTIPSVMYMSEAKACQVLEEAGCIVNVEYEYNDIIAEGMVVKQSVKLGEKLEEGQKVTITVSLGAKSEATPKPKNADQSKNTPKPTKTPKPAPTSPATTAPATPLPTSAPVQTPTPTKPAVVSKTPEPPEPNVITESTNSVGADSIFTN